MLFKSSALALLVVASQVVAEPQPYKAAGAVHKMSVRELFGVVRRAGSDGYSPSTSLCGLGNTCAEACGDGYATCKSTDDAIHCYNPAAAQICCPDGSGNSCDDGYYCTGSVGGDTVCCPDSQSLTECAAAYSVSGSLTIEVATSSASSSAFSSSSAVVTSSAAPNTTTTSSSSSKATSTHHTTYKANSTVITSWGTSFTTTSCASGTGFSSAAASTAAAIGGNNFTTTGSPSATASTVSTSAGDFLKPAGVAAAMLAAAFTFLL